MPKDYVINYASVIRKVKELPSTGRKGEQAIKKKVLGKFNAAYEALLEEFDEHAVTREIAAGPGSDNISGTLKGYGDLFSFIGFTFGEQPTRDLRNILASSRADYRGYRNGVWEFRVYIPSKDKIEKETPMPWESGRSWAFDIERGISGFGHYMSSSRFQDEEDSYSKQGLQVKNKLRDGGYKKTKYLSELLRNFRKRLA